MIIEFFGLPGSGKTTMCNKLSKQEKYKNPMIFYKEKIIGKVFFHLFIYFFFLNPTLLRKYKAAKEVLKNEKYINIIDKNVKINLYLKYMVFVYYIESKYDMVAIDEGIIHYITALYAEFKVEYTKLNELFQIFKIKNKNIMYKCTNCKLEKAIENCKIRNRKKGPIDFLGEKELVELEKRYKEAEIYYIKYLKI